MMLLPSAVYYFIKKTIFGLVFLGGLTQGVFAQDPININEYTQLITKDIDNTWQGIRPEDKKVYNILNNLCNNIFNQGSTILSEGNTYNPQESVFVAVVCNSLQSKKKDKTAENKSRLLNTILKRKNIRDMGIICSQSQSGIPTITGSIGDTDCENRSFNNNLDYPFLFYKIIKQTQNDRINLSLARIYGAIDTQKKHKALANLYISDHFKTIGRVPEMKNYPDTYKTLTTYIKDAQNMQQESYFIDYKTITDETIKKNTLPRRSLFFLNTTSNSIDTATQQPTYHKINTDMIYNELFFYTIFTSIYTEYLNRFWSTDKEQEKAIPLSWLAKDITPGEAIILQTGRIKTQGENIRNAVRESIRQLGNLESSYPLHIGFLMYQEDLLHLRDNLVKIYLPLHQLHYKLENVQSKN